eukprot:35912_1
MEFMLAAMVGILQLLAKLMDQMVGYYLYFPEAEEWSTIAWIGVAVLGRPGRDSVYPSTVATDQLTNHLMITSPIIKSIKRFIISCIKPITPLVTSFIITCITTFITLI